MGQMGEGGVVIELDSAPPSFTLPTTGDYLFERCVVSALFRPALRLASASTESDYFELVVEDGHFFSDGSPVRADDVLRTLVTNAEQHRSGRGTSHTWIRLSIVGDRLCVSMRRPARFYPDLLRTVDFAPTHPDGLGNGPYRVGGDFDAEGGYYHLTPNPYVDGCGERPELTYSACRPTSMVHPTGSSGAKPTSPAAPPSRWTGSTSGGEAVSMHRAPTGIFMQVEPNPSGAGPLADPSLRRAMLGCLGPGRDRREFPRRPAARLA